MDKDRASERYREGAERNKIKERERETYTSSVIRLLNFDERSEL